MSSSPDLRDPDGGVPAAGAVLGLLPVPMSVATLDGTIVRCNAAYARLHGSTVEALTGTNLARLIHPDDRPETLPAPRDPPDLVPNERGTILFEERHQRLDDDRAFWVTVTLVPFHDRRGALAGYVATLSDREDDVRVRAALDDATWLRRTAGRLARFGAWAIGLPGYQLTWSAEVFEIMEVSLDDAPDSRRALGFYVPEDRARVTASIERCAEQGIAFDLEASVMTGTGERLEVRVAGEPRRDADGHITGLVGAFQDITDLVRAREGSRRASEQLTATLRHMADGVVVHDADWRISYVNPAGERLAGRDRAHLLGRVLWEAMPEVVGTELERLYRRAVVTGEPVLNERFVFAATGRTYRVSALPHGGGGLTAYLRDVTIEVIEQDRLREMAVAEHAAAEELRSLDRMKNAFITAVSHELRTPLTVIRGMADTLVRLRGHGEVDPVTRQRVEDALAEHAGRLGRLLDDLLDTDRLVRGVLVAERRQADVVAIARRAIEASPVAPRVTLQGPEQLDAAVDVVLVERCLRNLLENAGKYASRGSIVVEIAPDGAGGFLLAVADEGPGIPIDHRERVFEPFHRVLDHPQPGTGIGLSLVAEFARLHGGSAWVDRAYQRGARIVVAVPPG